MGRKGINAEYIQTFQHRSIIPQYTAKNPKYNAASINKGFKKRQTWLIVDGIALTPFSIALNPFSIVTLVTSTFIGLSNGVLVELFFKSCPQLEQNFAPGLLLLHIDYRNSLLHSLQNPKV